VIDIHNHFLPGLDDGATDDEVASAMLSMAAGDGITDIVATPHASPRYRYDREAVQEHVRRLQRNCDGITLHCGCDFHLSLENIRGTLKDPYRHAIDETPYLLVELPEFFHTPAMDRVMDELIAAGIIPIVTHPERHPILRHEPRILRTWVEHDCLVQITAQSILGDFGRTARHSSNELLRAGLVHIVASDAHDTIRRPPLLSEARLHVAKRYGAALAEALFTVNPGKVLAGSRIPAMTKPGGRFLSAILPW